MPRLREYDVFISHAWEYRDQYEQVCEFLDDAPRFDWVDLSVPLHDPIDAEEEEDLEYELRNKIRPANALIVLAGMYCAWREWIDFELAFARRIGRPIIGIRPWGSQRTPSAVANAAWEMVGWNRNSIVEAIRDHALPAGR